MKLCEFINQLEHFMTYHGPDFEIHLYGDIPDDPNISGVDITIGDFYI